MTALAPLLAGALTLTAVIAPARAADANFPANSGNEGGLPRAEADGTRPGQAARRGLRRGPELRTASGLLPGRGLDAVPGAKKLYDYDYTFNGFAARLTGRQAAKLAATPGVAAVTRSTVVKPIAPASPKKGLWATNPMLAPLSEPRPDADVIAKKWRGTCDEGDDSDPAHNVTCNNKGDRGRLVPGRAELPGPRREPCLPHPPECWTWRDASSSSRSDTETELSR